MNKESQPKHIITQFTKRDLTQFSKQVEQILKESIKEGHLPILALQSFIDQNIPDPKMRNRLVIASHIMDRLKELDVNIENVRTVLIWGPSDLSLSTISWETPSVDLKIVIKRTAHSVR